MADGKSYTSFLLKRALSQAFLSDLVLFPLIKPVSLKQQHVSISGKILNSTVRVTHLPPEQCTKKAAKEFVQFYYMDELDGKLACVTKCTPGTKSEMDCHHGRCELQQSGPRCL